VAAEKAQVGLAADDDKLQDAPEDAKAKRLARFIVREIKVNHEQWLAGGHTAIEAQEELRRAINLGRQWLHRRLGYDSERLDAHFRDAFHEFFGVTLPEGLPGVTCSTNMDDAWLAHIIREFKRGVDIQLGREDYVTRYNLGIAYMEMGLIDDAIAEFVLAARDDEHLFECASLLGICYLKKEMPKLAVEWFEKGLQQPGRDEDQYLALRNDLMSAHQAAGQSEEALKVFVQGVFSPSEVGSLSRLSALIVLVTRALRRETGYLTAEQEKEMLGALSVSMSCLAQDRTEEFDTCIRRLESALRILEIGAS
jgi:tetratricopeptide (TPR) repeat protein